MKLAHWRYFDGRLFKSVEHFSFKDPLANKLAAAIREETGARCRVVTDHGPGWTHVFVERDKLDEAYAVAERPEFLA